MSGPRGVDLLVANMGQLDSAQKVQPSALLPGFNKAGLLTVDPKRAEAVRVEPLRLRLNYPKCRPFLASTGRHLLGLEAAVQDKVHELNERRVIEYRRQCEQPPTSRFGRRTMVYDYLRITAG